MLKIVLESVRRRVVGASLALVLVVSLVGCLAPEQLATPTMVPTVQVETSPEAIAAETPIAPEARVFFIVPLDGATIPVSSTVVMGVTGLEVAPAGEVKEGSGHLHILVDSGFIPAGQAIPNDEHHLHFGKGQLTAPLTLTPGEHVLRLQFADGAHMALDGAQYRDEITVTVEE